MTSTTMELADKYAVCCWSDGSNDEDFPATIEARAALEQRIKELEMDAKRFVEITKHLDTGMYLVDAHTPCDYYDDDAGITTDLQVWRLCVDAVMSEAALQKAVEISQEYKLP